MICSVCRMTFALKEKGGETMDLVVIIINCAVGGFIGLMVSKLITAHKKITLIEAELNEVRNRYIELYLGSEKLRKVFLQLAEEVKNNDSKKM